MKKDMDHSEHPRTNSSDLSMIRNAIKENRGRNWHWKFTWKSFELWNKRPRNTDLKEVGKLGLWEKRMEKPERTCGTEYILKTISFSVLILDS